MRIEHGGTEQQRVVKTGSSYLSQSERALTFGVGKADLVDRVTVDWPSGASQEFTRVTAKKAHQITEDKGLSEISGF